MDTVICGLCSKILSSPRVLNCCHEFDSKCLEELCSQNEFSAALSCPTCGSETELPSGGIAALPIDYSALRFALLNTSSSGYHYIIILNCFINSRRRLGKKLWEEIGGSCT